MELDLNLKEEYKETKLGLLPKDWEVVRLGDVVRFVRGISWSKKDENPDGVPVIAIPNVHEGRVSYNIRYWIVKNLSEAKRLDEGDILLVGSSGSVHNVGRTAVVQNLPFKQATFASFLVKVIPSEIINEQYLFYLLQSNVVDFAKCSKRAADGKFNLQLMQLSEFKVPLPPLSEQKKIAYVLSTVQEAKEKTDDVIKATKELKKSMMKYLFTYGPVSWKEAEKVPLKETEIGLIPDEWEVVRLGDIANFKNGINFSANQKGNRGILTIDVLNMYGEGIYVNLNNLYRVNKKIDENYLLREDDILFVRSSLKREGVGWSSLFKPTNEPVTFCGFIIRARLKVENVFPEYLTNYLRTKIARNNLIASSGKVAITNINQGMLGEIIVPCSPLQTQKKIASILSVIDQKIEAEESKKKALEDLFKSLLYNLMTAKIRVNNLEKILDE